MADVQYIKITKETLNDLLKHKKRTGLGPYAITKGRKRPRGLSGKVLDRVLTGVDDEMNPYHLAYVLERYEATPDRPIKKVRYKSKPNAKPYVFESYEEIKPYIGIEDRGHYIDIPEGMIEEFIKYKESGLSVSNVLSLTNNIPLKLTSQLISSWITGGVRKASKEYLDFYLKACREAAKHPKRHVTITDELLELMRAQKQRTGRAGATLLKDRKDVPYGLHAPMINSWINKTAVTARKDYIEYTINLWLSTPDKHIKIKKVFSIQD